ncbi:hypothetical protein BGW38_009850 [Lunasporangiospora selenospora]|uniref:Uncharacterized protein n=1 Tax=Lunasporangiospora selenospora TaxID=979761 RepID=A0A9P6FWS2_9FUNG|nr:hypothetical protein BGW38_009850 [Lunasporangiospora selenospora]
MNSQIHRELAPDEAIPELPTFKSLDSTEVTGNQSATTVWPRRFPKFIDDGNPKVGLHAHGITVPFDPSTGEICNYLVHAPKDGLEAWRNKTRFLKRRKGQKDFYPEDCDGGNDKEGGGDKYGCYIPLSEVRKSSETTANKLLESTAEQMSVWKEHAMARLDLYERLGHYHSTVAPSRAFIQQQPRPSTKILRSMSTLPLEDITSSEDEDHRGLEDTSQSRHQYSQKKDTTQGIQYSQKCTSCILQGFECSGHKPICSQCFYSSAATTRTFQGQGSNAGSGSGPCTIPGISSTGFGEHQASICSYPIESSAQISMQAFESLAKNVSLMNRGLAPNNLEIGGVKVYQTTQGQDQEAKNQKVDEPQQEMVKSLRRKQSNRLKDKPRVEAQWAIEVSNSFFRSKKGVFIDNNPAADTNFILNADKKPVIANGGAENSNVGTLARDGRSTPSRGSRQKIERAGWQEINIQRSSETIPTAMKRLVGNDGISLEVDRGRTQSDENIAETTKEKRKRTKSLLSSDEELDEETKKREQEDLRRESRRRKMSKEQQQKHYLRLGEMTMEKLQLQGLSGVSDRGRIADFPVSRASQMADRMTDRMTEKRQSKRKNRIRSTGHAILSEDQHFSMGSQGVKADKQHARSPLPVLESDEEGHDPDKVRYRGMRKEKKTKSKIKLPRYKKQMRKTYRPWTVATSEHEVRSYCEIPETSLLQALHYYASYYYTNVQPAPDMFESMDLTAHIALGMIVQETISDFAFKLGKNSQAEDEEVKQAKIEFEEMESKRSAVTVTVNTLTQGRRSHSQHQDPSRAQGAIIQGVHENESTSQERDQSADSTSTEARLGHAVDINIDKELSGSSARRQDTGYESGTVANQKSLSTNDEGDHHEDTAKHWNGMHHYGKDKFYIGSDAESYESGDEDEPLDWRTDSWTQRSVKQEAGRESTLQAPSSFQLSFRTVKSDVSIEQDTYSTDSESEDQRDQLESQEINNIISSEVPNSEEHRRTTSPLYGDTIEKTTGSDSVTDDQEDGDHDLSANGELSDGGQEDISTADELMYETGLDNEIREDTHSAATTASLEAKGLTPAISHNLEDDDNNGSDEIEKSVGENGREVSSPSTLSVRDSDGEEVVATVTSLESTRLGRFFSQGSAYSSDDDFM